jgi:hypothetical protein
MIAVAWLCFATSILGCVMTHDSAASFVLQLTSPLFDNEEGVKKLKKSILSTGRWDNVAGYSFFAGVIATLAFTVLVVAVPRLTSDYNGGPTRLLRNMSQPQMSSSHSINVRSGDTLLLIVSQPSTKSQMSDTTIRQSDSR